MTTAVHSSRNMFAYGRLEGLWDQLVRPRVHRVRIATHLLAMDLITAREIDEEERASRTCAASQALDCLELAVASAKRGNVEDAWIKHHAAAEAWLHGLTFDELHIEFAVLRKDAKHFDSKHACDRHEAVCQRIEQLLARAETLDADDSAAALEQHRRALAAMVSRLKHIATLYYSNRFAGSKFIYRAQMMAAVAILFALLTAVGAFYLSGDSGLFYRYGIGLVFGALGGSMSALYDIAKLESERSVSRVWASSQFILLRPLLGAVGALIVMMAEFEGLTNAFFDPDAAELQGIEGIHLSSRLWLLAFVSGFSERLFSSFTARYGGRREQARA